MRDWHDDYMKKENDCGEDLRMKYTGYRSKAEEDYWENGGYEADMEAREAARDIRESEIREGFLDAMEIPRDSACRGCEWMKEAIIEAYEDQVDDDLCIPEEAFEMARRMCAECKKHTPEERDEALRAFWKAVDEE